MGGRYGISFSNSEDVEGLVATITGTRLSIAFLFYPDGEGGLSFSASLKAR